MFAILTAKNNMMMIHSNNFNRYMGNSSKRNEVISRTEKEIACIRALTDPKYQELLGVVRRNKLREMLRKLEILQDKLKQNLFEVSIVGLEKSGKSTFANAYMEIDILPTKDERCTYTATSICYGNEDSAQVSFYSEQEFNAEFLSKIGKLGLPLAEVPADWRQWTKELLDEAIRQLPPLSAEEKNLQRDLEEILENRSILSSLLDEKVKEFTGMELESEIKAYIEEPSKALAVKKIVISSHKLAKNQIIYDVPGFDSPTELHKQQTREWMKKSDAVILIVNADRPSFNDSLVQFFGTIDKDEDGIPIGEKVFIFANRADVASTLQMNLEKIQTELVRYDVVPRNLVEKRLFAGSAKAKLESEKGITTCMELLRQNGLDNDGIEEIRNKLNEYNDTTRVQVMNRRINHIRQQILELLAEIQKENQVQDENSLDREIKYQADNLLMTSKDRIIDILTTYYNETQSKYQGERPITKKMREYITTLVDPSTCQITEEELRRAKNQEITESGTIRNAEYTVRGEKYVTLYNEFIKHVVNLAVDEYYESEQALITSFEKGLGISASHPYYEQLQKSIKQYIKNKFENFAPEGYYNSLIRRYSGNLFLILIRQPFTEESRFDLFEEERPNFYSLALFGSKEALSIRPDVQPMHAQILYHEQADDRRKEAATFGERLVLLAENRIHEVIPENSELYNLLMQLAEMRKSDAETVLTTILSDLRSKDIREDGLPLFAVIPNPLEEELLHRLRIEISLPSQQISQVSFTTKEYYLNYFINYKKQHNKGTGVSAGGFQTAAKIIAQEFKEDVEILKDILNHQVMDAIAIEVPFLDLVEQNVTTLKKSVQSSDFMGFIRDNEEMILSEEYERLHAENEIKQKRAEILHEIETIIETEREEA